MNKSTILVEIPTQYFPLKRERVGNSEKCEFGSGMVKNDFFTKNLVYFFSNEKVSRRRQTQPILQP
ncbi:MAG: hypothetical protein P8Q41_05060 [Saprospiraceae bacterium]|nr:hypothetical protein [Saprospiraceae bacterium]